MILADQSGVERCLSSSTVPLPLSVPLRRTLQSMIADMVRDQYRDRSVHTNSAVN